MVEPRAALKKDAPQVHPEAPGNLALDWPGRLPSEENEREVDKIIAGAAHVARVTRAHQRLMVASMETRGATGAYDAKTDSYTLYACSQSAGGLRNNTAPVMGVANDKLRVLTGDVGGAFGMKSPVYPEYPVLLVAAKKIGRPVRWQSTRSEAFMTDTQGRDSGDRDGACARRQRKIPGAAHAPHLRRRRLYHAGRRQHQHHERGALPARHVPHPQDRFHRLLVFTNTAPIGPYRGAGRPEANYALDRAVEEAARITGIDSARLRKKNLIPPSAMPYKTAVGTTYDSGDFPAIFAKAMEMSDYKNFNKRKRASAKAQETPRHRHFLHARTCRRDADRKRRQLVSRRRQADLGLNVQSTGQAHATVFGRLLADKLGIDRI